MKNLILPFLALSLFTACQKEIYEDQVPIVIEQISGFVAKSPPTKINVCHLDAVTNTWHTINISINAWPSHQAHGDVRLDDQDGDSYVPANACGYGQMGDCDDTNAGINPGAEELCGNTIDENCNGLLDENCLEIGAEYQGGIIAYILQPGDPGYDANVPHGLIAAASDHSAPAPWGCYGTIIPGADGTAIGTGNQNTIDIMAGCADPDIAARICGDLSLNGYSDWYLPSKDELNKLYINREAIGGFAADSYWSSSEFYNGYAAWFHIFYNGDQDAPGKHNAFRVRAVRSF